MGKRITRVATIAVIAVVLALGLAAIANASPWNDLSDSMPGGYQVSAGQASAISSGYADNTFRPQQSITRAQFVKMEDVAFDVSPLSPSTPTFSDVPRTHFYLTHIEGAYAVQLVNGRGGGRLGPELTLPRQQAIAMIARRAAAMEGLNLASMTEAEISAALVGHIDAKHNQSVHDQ